MDDAKIHEDLGEIKATQRLILDELAKGHARFDKQETRMDKHDERLRGVEKKVFLGWVLGTAGVALAPFWHDVRDLFGGH